MRKTQLDMLGLENFTISNNQSFMTTMNNEKFMTLEQYQIN